MVLCNILKDSLDINEHYGKKNSQKVPVQLYHHSRDPHLQEKGQLTLSYLLF